MTCFVSGGTLNLDSVNQLALHLHLSLSYCALRPCYFEDGH